MRIFLLILLGLAALFFWAARRPETWPSTRIGLNGGAWVILALAGVVGYAVIQEARAPGALARYLPLYPGARSTTWVPKGRE